MVISKSEKKVYWVIVADKASAVFYSRKSKKGNLSKNFEFENPLARQKAAQYASDRNGRSFDSHGKGRHAMSKEVDPKVHEARQFAKFIVQKIKALDLEDRLLGYTLIAAPKFLGDLRKSIELIGCPQPRQTFDKDVADQDVAAIEKFLESHSDLHVI